jgi:CheY-like chemotaxis protein
MRIDLERPSAWPVRPVRTNLALAASGPAVLIACPDAELAERVRESLAGNGHRLHLASDVVTALDLVETDAAIAIVIIKSALPHFDGHALARRMVSAVPRRLRFILAAAMMDDARQAPPLDAIDVINDLRDGRQLHGALARALAAHQDEAFTGRPPIAVPKPDGTASTVGDRLRILHTLQRNRDTREALFPQGLFDDSCWHMLVDLMICRLTGRRVSVSSLCIVAGGPQTTALRRIAEMKTLGLVRRVPDPRDGRRVFIELTEDGASALTRYLEHIETPF